MIEKVALSIWIEVFGEHSNKISNTLVLKKKKFELNLRHL